MKETWKEKWKPHAIGYTYEHDKQAKAVQFALELATPQIFDFISKEIIEKIIDDTDDYFKGLLVAMDGQATRKNLIDGLKSKWLN